MSIRDVIETLNQMETDGVIERYAIADAVGATFYLEPVATYDADVFIAFRSEPGKLLVSQEPVFDYLRLLVQGVAPATFSCPVCADQRRDQVRAC
jgi:hypothetical protein